MAMSSGPLAAAFSACDRSATCGGLSTLRRKGTTPATPRPISSSSSAVGARPWIPAITQRAARVSKSKSLPSSVAASPTTNPPRLRCRTRECGESTGDREGDGPAACSVVGARTKSRSARLGRIAGRTGRGYDRASGRARPREVDLFRAEQQSRRTWRRAPALLLAFAAFLALPATAAPDARESLRKSVDQLFMQPPLSGTRASVAIVSLEDGSTVYMHDGDAALNPASNTKLITAAAALLRLGPEFRFSTEMLAERAPDKRGRVGTLYVRGRGDPALTTERRTGMARDLFHRGVRSVADLVVDDSYFDAEKWGPGWEQESSDKAYAAPVGALSLNHNTVAIYVRPGDRAGMPAKVELEPDAPGFFRLGAQVATVRTNGRRKIRPHTFEVQGGTTVTVEGRLPAGGDPMLFYRRVTEPGLYFGHTFRAVLAQNGIRVTGRVRRAVAPAAAYPVASYDSEELADIVRDMNKVSSNFIAEMLLKTLRAELRGAPGTWAKRLDVTQDLLAELGLPRRSHQLNNGSGLNQTNRFSAHQMVTLLTAIWKRFPVAAEFVSSLGIAARDGTLRLRMEGTDAAGRLRAKTGTLEKVTALSGFVQSVGGERFAFSILVNDWTGRSTPIVSSVDRLGGILASSGISERDALVSIAPVELSGPELRLRVATYAAMAKAHDKKNLSYLRSAVRSEHEPAVRIM